MHSDPLPYEPVAIVVGTHAERARTSTVLISAISTLSAFSAVASFILRPDVEGFLSQIAFGRPSSDAFAHINAWVPFFLSCLTCATFLLLWIDKLRRPIFALPMVAGSMMATAGWSLAVDFREPEWFGLIALTTIALFVSSVVTMMLMLATFYNERIDRRA